MGLGGEGEGDKPPPHRRRPFMVSAASCAAQSLLGGPVTEPWDIRLASAVTVHLYLCWR